MAAGRPELIHWQLLLQDIRASRRLLARSPLVTAAAIATLAFGIGACVTVFSVTDTLLLNSLQYPQSDRLVMLWESHPHQKGEWRLASYPTFLDWRRQLDDLEGLAASQPWRPILTDGEALASLQGSRVSTDFFSVLAVQPAHGRGFAPGEEEPGSTPVVVLSHGLWERRFGGSLEILGRPISLDDSGSAVEATVIGILPPEARISAPLVLETAEIFTPLKADPQRGARYFRVVGRLKTDAAVARTAAHLDAIAAGFREHHPQTHTGWNAEIARVEELVEAPVRPALFALLVAVGLVFLIACTNVGILNLARETDRYQEIAIRLALGADPAWIGRRLLTESLLLCGISGLLGLVLSRTGLSVLEGLGFTAGRAVTLDLKVVAFAVLISLTTALFLGLLPALRAAGADVQGVLRAHRSSRGASLSGLRLRRALVLSEIAVAVVLLIMAGLMMHSLLQLIRVDTGFEPRGALTLRLQLPRSLHPRGSEIEDLMERLREEVEALPQVKAAGLINFLPMVGTSFGTQVRTLPEASSDEHLRIELRGISRGYFGSMGIPLVAGRDLEATGKEQRDSVIVLSESAAERLWPGESAVGKRLLLDWGSGEFREVIGVVGSVRQQGARTEANPTVYIPFSEAPRRSLTLVARAAAGTSTLAPEIRARALDLNRTFVIDEIRTLSQVVHETVNQPKGQTLILGGFAAVALVLAAGGVYSVVAYSISQRRYDLGVRLALGAHPNELVKRLTAERLRDAVVGIGIGLLASLPGTRLLSGLLYGIDTTDPWTLTGTSVLLVGIVLIASYLPARSAARIDPAAMLRSG